MRMSRLTERRTSVPGVAGGAFAALAGGDLAAAGAFAFGDATGLAAGAFALRAAFFAGRPKPSAMASSVSSSAAAVAASTGGVMYGDAASTSIASCGGNAIGVQQSGDSAINGQVVSGMRALPAADGTRARSVMRIGYAMTRALTAR